MRRCAAIAALVLAAASPLHAAFNPVEFFRGKSHGTGKLKIFLHPSQAIEVQSVGRAEKDGTLVVSQLIREPHKAPRTRYWRVREVGPNRYAGTLTDAKGPVTIEPEGDALRIRYTDNDNLEFDQRLIQTGARSVRNLIKVRRFGIVVATVDETIRKLD